MPTAVGQPQPYRGGAGNTEGAQQRGCAGGKAVLRTSGAPPDQRWKLMTILCRAVRHGLIERHVAVAGRFPPTTVSILSSLLLFDYREKGFSSIYDRFPLLLELGEVIK
jgi:hypothetical protein